MSVSLESKNILGVILLSFFMTSCLSYFMGFPKNYQEHVYFTGIRLSLWDYQKERGNKFYMLSNLVLDSNFLLHFHFDKKYYSRNSKDKQIYSLPGGVGPEDTIRSVNLFLQNQEKEVIQVTSLFKKKSLGRGWYTGYTSSDSLNHYYMNMRGGEVMNIPDFIHQYNESQEDGTRKLSTYTTKGGFTLEGKLASSDFFAQSKKVMFKAEVVFTNGRVLVDSMYVDIIQ